MSQNGHEVVFYDWRGYMDCEFGLIRKNSYWLKFVSRLVLPYLNIFIRNILFRGDQFCISLISGAHSKNINNIQADICHLHWTQNEFLSLRQIGKIKNVVITAHDTWWANGLYHLDKHSFTVLRKIQIWRVRRFLSKNKICFITPSYWLENLLKKNLGLTNNVHVIRNIVKRPVRVEDPAQVSRGVLFVSWVISSTKGAEDLLQLAAVMETSAPNETLHLVGSVSTHLRDAIKKRFTNVKIWGRLSPTELEALYISTKCVVYPSHFDNLPSVVVEAIKCGTPVVAYDVGGISEILANTVNGHIVTKGDTDSLTKRVLGYLLDYAPSRETVVNSLSSQFDDNHIFHQTHKIYGDLK